MEKNEALARVRGIERDIHRLTYDLKETIVSAVIDGGATWPEIGNALGLSKQTAHARYGLDVKIERDHRQWAIDNPERHAAAVARGQAAAAADLAQIEAEVAAKRASKISDPDVAGTSETPSIFSDATAPAPRELDTKTAENFATGTKVKNPKGQTVDYATTSEPIHAGITDTSGEVIDWTGRRQFKNPAKCPFCGLRTHYDRRPQHWWIYPSCTLTDADYTSYDSQKGTK